MQVLGELGINGGLLLAQAVNFGLIVAIIYFFLHKPLGDIIDERRKKIEEGLRRQEEATELLHRIQVMRQDIMRKIEIEREDILKKTNDEALQLQEDARKKLQTFEKGERKKIEQELKNLEMDMLESVQKKMPEVFLSFAKKMFKDERLNKEFIETLLKQK
ncbi:MAG: ATP synthase subunit b [Parcubacteria group bacterium GW2011_GWC1_41_7]|nr:MAG: ATP synthase subunit b [Parcubacteria group bacterium GW2011_GWC1_41_7]